MWNQLTLAFIPRIYSKGHSSRCFSFRSLKSFCRNPIMQMYLSLTEIPLSLDHSDLSLIFFCIWKWESKTFIIQCSEGKIRRKGFSNVRTHWATVWQTCTKIWLAWENSLIYGCAHSGPESNQVLLSQQPAKKVDHEWLNRENLELAVCKLAFSFFSSIFYCR